MTNVIMNSAQLEGSAKGFIHEFCLVDSASTAMIVAGMVSIILYRRRNCHPQFRHWIMSSER